MFLLFLLIPAWFFITKYQKYNTDIIFYLALSQGVDSTNVIEVHDKIYKSLKELAPADKFEELKGDLNSDKRETYDYPQAMLKHLPLYSIKPLYIALISIFNLCGVKLAFSPVLISLIFFTCLALVLFHWLQEYFSNPMSLLITVMLCYSPPVLYTSHFASPDLMAGFLYLLICYFVFERNHLLEGTLLSMIVIASRLDFIIPCFLLYLFLWLNKVMDWKYFVFAVFIFLMVYIVVTFSMGSTWGLNYYSAYAAHHNIAGVNENYQQQNFFRNIIQKIHWGYRSYFYAMCIICFLIAISPAAKIFKNAYKDYYLVLLLLTTMCIRILAQPQMHALDDRFYFSYYLMILLIACIKFCSNRDKALAL